MATEQDFYDNPKKFMQSNVVLVSTNADDFESVRTRFCGLMSLPEKKDILRIKLRQLANFTTDKPGGAVWAMYPIDVRAKGGRLIYYCRYKENNGMTAQIGLETDYMFTAQMNGCTFAIGSQVQNGVLHVGHFNNKKIAADYENLANAANDPNGSALAGKLQTVQQASFAKQVLGDDAKLVKPKYYKSSDAEAATLFGYRKANKWHFYTLTFEKSGNQFLHKGVRYHVKGSNMAGPLANDD